MSKIKEVNVHPDKNKVKVEIVNGVEGICIYMNDYRICGQKPWGGGTVVKTFFCDKDDIKTAMKRKCFVTK